MSTSSYDFLVEEEAQVVPSSLDHLSRHELCHMIYRLDYERHTLKEKLVALRLAVSASNVGGVGRGGGGGGRRRTKQQTTTSTLEKKCRQGKKKACSDDDNEEEKVAKMQKTNNDSDESIQQEPTTLEEINAIHKRLTQTVISEIKVTTHGGLLRPRTTVEENDISLTTAMHIMQQWGDKLTHDTKRMIKWEFKSSCEDNDIAKFLQCEKYLRGVRHNGKGFLVGSNGNNGSSFTQFAKFESMIVSYDKLTMMMKVQVSTRGCNEKGIS